MYIRVNSRDSNALEGIKRILRGANGDIEVIIKYEDTQQVMKAPQSMWVNVNDGREEELIGLLGSENVRLVER